HLPRAHDEVGQLAHLEHVGGASAPLVEGGSHVSALLRSPLSPYANWASVVPSPRGDAHAGPPAHRRAAAGDRRVVRPRALRGRSLLLPGADASAARGLRRGGAHARAGAAG